MVEVVRFNTDTTAQTNKFTTMANTLKTLISSRRVGDLTMLYQSSRKLISLVLLLSHFSFNKNMIFVHTYAL